MSLLKTLAKVAIGVAVAKGVSGMMKGGSSQAGGQAPAGSSGGGLLDSLTKNVGGQTGQAGTGGQSGGMGDLLGQVLGGGSGSTGGASGGQAGGLGGLLEQLGGGAGGAGGKGGLGDLLGGLAGAGGAGGLGGLLGGLASKAPQQRNSGGSFGELLNESLGKGGEEPSVQPSADEEAMAALMLRAMIQAAKSDGKLDDNERQRLMENLKDGDQDEIEFVNRELAAPIDIDGLASQVPAGMQQQVYVMSVMGINLDEQAEAEYLHKLATAMGLDQQAVNNVHDQLGVQRIYG